MAAIHHLELWTTDVAASAPGWDWLLTRLGWVAEPLAGWDEGRIWRADGGEYLVLEQSPAITGLQDRMRAGMNHVALVVPDRGTLDGLRREASAHGWTEMFPERYPHAGGPDHVALYLEDAEGFEVELVVTS